MMVSASRCRSARIAGDRHRVGDVGLAGEALLALVGRGAELGGLAHALDLLGRQVGCSTLLSSSLSPGGASSAGQQSQ